MNTRLMLGGLAIAVGLCTQASATPVAVINFTAEVKPGGYTGTPLLDPFIPGTPTHALVNGLGGFAGQASQDWLRFNGQIVISDYDGPGTYEITPDNGAGGIYLVAPLLNRIEADSWRRNTADPIATPGAGPADGDPPAVNDDIYLPDFTPNGTATVMIDNANNVTIDYGLDFSTLPDTNAAFLRGGDTDTDISDLLEGAGVIFGEVSVSDSGQADVMIFDQGGDSGAPLGGYNALSDGTVSIGNLSNTIIPTTYGLLRDEIGQGNIRRGTMDDTLLTLTSLGLTPFLDDLGTTTFFDLTGGPTFDAAVSTVPAPVSEPATLAVFGMCGTMLLAARRRRT